MKKGKSSNKQQVKHCLLILP